MASDDSKTCLMCGATIKAIASKCRFCGEALSPINVPSPLARDMRRSLFEPRSFIGIFVALFPVLALMWGLLWTWGFAVPVRETIHLRFPSDCKQPSPMNLIHLPDEPAGVFLVHFATILAGNLIHLPANRQGSTSVHWSGRKANIASPSLYHDQSNRQSIYSIDHPPKRGV